MKVEFYTAKSFWRHVGWPTKIRLIGAAILARGGFIHCRCRVGDIYYDTIRGHGFAKNRHNINHGIEPARVVYLRSTGRDSIVWWNRHLYQPFWSAVALLDLPWPKRVRSCASFTAVACGYSPIYRSPRQLFDALRYKQWDSPK